MNGIVSRKYKRRLKQQLKEYRQFTITLYQKENEENDDDEES
jgi:hypothetical protein